MPSSGGTQAERVASLALGFAHTCVLLESGKVRCWGKDQNAIAGGGSGKNLGDDESPALARPIDLGGKAVQISAGGATCALLDTGSVRCWGQGVIGYPGQKWRGRPLSALSPAELGDLDLGALVVQVSVGSEHQCARTERGSVRCWGMSRLGELGYGSRRSVGSSDFPASPGDVPIGAKVTQVVAGRFQSCALVEASRLRCWGAEPELNGAQRIEDSFATRPASAYPVFDFGAPVLQVSAGGPICVLLTEGRVRCWGSNESGELGYGHRRAIATPAAAGDVHVGEPVLQITTGEAHVCALLSEGRVRCWGKGSDGALGYGNGLNIGDDETPDRAGDVPVGGRVVQLAAGGQHTCALLDTGKVRCWGAGQYGQLRYGNTQRVGDNESPAQVGDVQLFAADQRRSPAQPWIANASPSAAPLLRAELRPPRELWQPEQCAARCPQCKVLFDGARSLRALADSKPRPLSENERASFNTAYRQYLESPDCLAYDGAPDMDPRAIGSAQDPARVNAVVDAAFSAPGRAQTLVVAWVGKCGSRLQHALPHDPGESLAVLLEPGGLISSTVVRGWDHALARDLDTDGMAEVVGFTRYTGRAQQADETVLEVLSYAGGKQRPLAFLSAEQDDCDEHGTHAVSRITYGPGAKNGTLCFHSKQLSLACPNGRKSELTRGEGGPL